MIARGAAKHRMARAWEPARRIRPLIMASAAGVLALAGPARAQVVMSVSLRKAVALAARQYPHVQAARAARAAGRDSARLARLAYLPSVEIYGQLDRATQNNLGGLLFPNPMPVISGPVLAPSAASFWGGVGGASISWEPYAFGRRRAGVASARYEALSAAERFRLARLRARTAAAAAYLALLAADQDLRSSRSDTRRWRSVDRIVHALVRAQLRPAGDAARVDAELAAAQVAVVQVREARRKLAYRLAERLGEPNTRLVLQSRYLARNVPPSSGMSAEPRPGQFPAVRSAAARVLAVESLQREISRQRLPRAYLLGSVETRAATGPVSPAGSGPLGASASNWAAGASVEFSISRWLRTRRRERIARDQARRQRAHERGVRQRFEYAVRGAKADWQAAWRAAQIIPAELSAARIGEADARARYQTGLATVVDLVNAEQVLSRALSANAVARLNVWEALLRWEYLRGHVGPFLRSAARARKARRIP